MATLWPLSHQIQVNDNGDLAPRAKVFFFNPGTTAPRVVYKDSALSVPHSHPVVADGAGRFPTIFLSYGDFRYRTTDEFGAVLFDVDGVSNPEPSVGGGGGGGGGTAEGFATGDVMWQPVDNVRAGWVRENGKTIGSATSGATERANSDTQDLFVFLWNTYPNTVCPVSGGRGGSATADYLANKTIQLLSMRGRTPIGLDTMGNVAANILQASTTIDTTNGSTAVTPLSAAGIGIGMYVVSANVPAGTTVTNIAGSTITLSAAATATTLGTDARFSWFPDAQVAGNSAGRASVALVEAELAAHNHTGATTTNGAHSHTYDKASRGSTAAAGVNLYGVDISTGQATSTAGDHTHNIPTSGNNLPHINLQPAVLGTYFRKL